MKPYRIVRHPLVASDVYGIAIHVIEHSGSVEAGERRVEEVEALFTAIAESPHSGTRLSGRLQGYLKRHNERDQRLTVIFRPDKAQQIVYIHLVAFGGADWRGRASRR